MRSALEIVVVTGYGYLGIVSKKSRVRDSPAFSKHTAAQAVQVELHSPFWHELNEVGRAYETSDPSAKCYAPTGLYCGLALVAGLLVSHVDNK